MPGGRNSDVSGDDAPKPSLWMRFQSAVVKPDDDPKTEAPQETLSVEELQAENVRANDKERAIGLIAAPLAAVVGLIISSASVNYARTHHQSVAIYDELTYVILGMSVLILLTAWFRKRLLLGIVMALYGLAVFNLHYWGFGVPFVMGGAWYLVRAYRINQRLKLATEAASDAPKRGSPGKGSTSPASRPRPSKRYTPPA